MVPEIVFLKKPVHIMSHEVDSENPRPRKRTARDQKPEPLGEISDEQKRFGSTTPCKTGLCNHLMPNELENEQCSLNTSHIVLFLELPRRDECDLAPAG